MQDNVASVHRFRCQIDNCMEIFENWQALIRHKIAGHPSQPSALAACGTVTSEMSVLQSKLPIEEPKHHDEEQTVKAELTLQTSKKSTTKHAIPNKVVITKITTVPKTSAATQPALVIPEQLYAGTVFSSRRPTAANLFHQSVIGEPLQVVHNNVVYIEEGNVDQQLNEDDQTRSPFTSDFHPEIPRQNLSWDEHSTKHLLSIVDSNRNLLEDKLTKSKKVWDIITNLFNQGTGNQLTSKQCSDKYKNMLRTFKTWKTACMATGAATPKKLFYFEQLEDIVGSSHTITTPFLDDSEGSMRPKSAPPYIAPMKRNLPPVHSSCHPTSSREAPSVMVTSNKRPAETSAAQHQLAKRVMHDNRSTVADQMPAFDYEPQPGPSGLGGQRGEFAGEQPSNIEDYLEVELGDDPAVESERPTKFRKKQLRPKSHNQLIQEYLVKQEERMARQEERGHHFQEQQLHFFKENSKAMATFNNHMSQWLDMLKKKKKKKSRKGRESSSSSSTEESN